MIISPWLIYFADLADNFKGALIALSIISGIILFLSPLALAIISDVSNNKDSKEKSIKIVWKVIKILLIIFPLSIFINVILPSTTTIYKMIVVPAVINAPLIQKLPDELQQFIDKELKVNP